MENLHPRRILLVEDDPKLSSLVKEYLETNNFLVAVESRGDLAGQRILLEKPDLVILDIMLPGKDGRTICREVRPRYDGPILMMSALGGEIDQVIGLETGADDYLAKPVHPRLLLSRINALLRRWSRPGATTEPAPPPAEQEPPLRIVLDSMTVDAGRRTVVVAGKPVVVSNAEFELLYFLARHPGEILTRDQIYRAVRGLAYDGLDRSIDLRIARLRKKLGDNGKHPQLIKSIHGEGYLLVTAP